MRKSSERNSGKSHQQPTYNIPIDKKIANTLLQNNADLLVSICQSSFVGNTAASVSLGVLALLRKQEVRVVESFLKRLLTNKVEEYVAKGRDLNDIIRDNSMPTIMINSYATYEGVAYLGNCIQTTLIGALSKLENCEIDPSKVGSSMENASLESQRLQIMENKERLIDITLSFVDSITNSKEQMPKSLKNMCTFLNNLLSNESIYNIANPKDPSQPATRMSCLSQNGQSVSSPLSQQFNEINGSDASSIHVNTVRIPDLAGRQGQNPLQERRASDTRSLCSNNALADHDNGTLLATSGNASNSKFGTLFQSKKRSKKVGRPPRPASTSSPTSSKDNLIRPRNTTGAPVISTSSINILNTIHTADGVARSGGSCNSPTSNSVNQSLEVIPHQSTCADANTIASSGALRESPSQLVLSSNRVSAIGILTRSERVVASFLFLRFFVPAITSPESHGLLDKRLSIAGRRGLILIGKLLAALCNDVEFGSKEAFMMIMNPFLKENREKIKAFIVFATLSDPESIISPRRSGSPHSTNERIPSPHNSLKLYSTRDDDIHPLPPKLSIRLGGKGKLGSRSNISASLPSLQMPSNLAPLKDAKGIGNDGTTRGLTRAVSSDFDETTNFFSFLGKSMHKIELDLLERCNTSRSSCSDTGIPIAVSRNTQLMDTFFELKALIENSPYADPDSKKRATGAAGLLAKFTKLRLKALFTASSNSISPQKKKFLSLDDLGSSAAATPRSRNGLGKFEINVAKVASANSLV